MDALDKISICTKAAELLTLINNCDDWYFADFVKDAISSNNVRDLDEAKAVLSLTLN